MFNQVTMIGNLTRDIELRYTQGGMAIASVGIASSHKFTTNGEKKEEVMFVDLAFFAKSAEIANQYLRKGSKIFITGRLKFDQWVGQDGQKHSKHSVVVETMKMLDSKTQEKQEPVYEYQNAQGQVYQPQPSHTAYREPQRQAPQQNRQSLPVDDFDDVMPF